jgi:hypothetical protein
VSVRDSAGIRIVTSSVDGLPVRRVAPEPELTIGSLDGEDGLYQLASVDRRSDGSWVTANGGSREIRIFSPAGGLEQVIGGQGDGPGEFQRLSGAVVLPGDSLFASDGQARRGTFFTPEGEVLETVTGTAEDPLFIPLRPLSNGNMAATGISRFGGGEMKSETVIRPETPLGILDRRGVLVAELGSLPGPERWFWSEGNSVSIRSLPFARGNQVEASMDRVFTGATETPEISVWDAEGSLAQLWRLDHEPPAVTSAELDRIRADELAEIDDPTYRRQTEALFASGQIPEVYPAWGRLLVSAEGELWIQQFDPPGSDAAMRWWRMAVDGAAAEVIELPPGFRLLWASRDLVAGRVTDELDVEYLRVYRLEG